MRILMWFALGFGAACAGCAYLLPAGVGWAMGAVFFVICGAIFIFSRKYSDIASAAVVFLGCAVGLLWWQGYNTVYLRSPALLNDQTGAYTLVAEDYSFATKYGIGVDCRMELDGKQYKVRVYLDDADAVQPGDNLSGVFRFSFQLTDDSGAYYSAGSRGVFLYAYEAGQISLITPDKIPLRYYPVLMRHRLLGLMDAVFPEDTVGFAKALVLGEDSGIDYETDSAFKISGIRHIIAVSGLHVSILCGAIYFITGRRRYLTSILGIAVLLLFAAVAGFTPSITRACIMTCLTILALLFNREYDGPTALAFAALVMLLINPITIISVSFQLSFGCMLGIFLFAEKISNWLLLPGRLGEAKGRGIKSRMKRWLAGSVSVSLSAMVFTTALTAYYFGLVSLVSVITNLLALWMVSFVFYGIILSCITGAVLAPVGKLLAWLTSWLIQLIIAIAKGMASLPFAAVYMNRWLLVAWLSVCYILLAVFLLRKGKRSALVPISLGVITLCAALMICWLPSAKQQLRISVLDVGQGQCVVLQNEGRTFLVDCGGENQEKTADTVAAELLCQGISRIDGIILTHFDADHCGAVENLLSRVHTDAIYVPANGDSSLYGRRETVIIWEETSFSFGDTKITLFPARGGETSNENSMCVLFQSQECDILVTGDRTLEGEMELLASANLPQLEILVAGHHGARTSTADALLQAVCPEIVVISVGADNSYGHPHEETLDRIENYNCLVHRTDLNGTFVYEG